MSSPIFSCAVNNTHGAHQGKSHKYNQRSKKQALKRSLCSLVTIADIKELTLLDYLVIPQLVISGEAVGEAS